MLFDLVAEIQEKVDIKFEIVNLGGGVGIPYRPEDLEVDLLLVGSSIRDLYFSKFGPKCNLKVAMECGRLITGPHGYLVTKAIHTKETYRKYIGVDATMANLMRPGMYGAYHEISVLNDDPESKEDVYDIVGSLCENNDKFATKRLLKTPQIGDFLVIHDVGAHGHAMGFNYNGKLKSAEFMLQSGGQFYQIRRAETLNDYFVTLNFPQLIL